MYKIPVIYACMWKSNDINVSKVEILYCTTRKITKPNRGNENTNKHHLDPDTYFVLPYLWVGITLYILYTITSHVFGQILGLSINFEAIYLKNKDGDIWFSICVWIQYAILDTMLVFLFFSVDKNIASHWKM